MRDHRTIVVGDHHKAFFVCQVIDRQTGEARFEKLESRPEVLGPFLKDLAKPVQVFIEAGRSWEWVAQVCEERGVELRLVDPSKMPEVGRSPKKTDRHDVEAMVGRLLAVGRLPESYRASREERELRGLTRRLGELRHDRRCTLQRIHAILDAHGMPGKAEQFEKEEWREGVRGRLTEEEWAVLGSQLRQLDFLLGESAGLEARLKAKVREREDVRLLQTVPGIGPILAATIVAEAADISRFPGPRAFAAYSGLVPRVRASGGKARLGHITKCGPPDLRWALTQAALTGSMSKTPSAHARVYWRKVKQGKRKLVARCAAAHKLARIVYRMLTRKEAFRPARRAKVA